MRTSSAYNSRMAERPASDVRDYLAGLALANQHEIEELRRAPVELKLRQIWSLMNSSRLYEDPIQREADTRQVQERWARLYAALHANTETGNTLLDSGGPDRRA
jgi:hypothetical protein